MKKSDIKKAYNAVKANEELKAKIFARLERSLDLEQDTDEIETVEIPLETSKKRKGGGFTAAVCAAAVVMILATGRLLPHNTELPAESSDTSSAHTENRTADRDTALVTLRVLDEKGVPVKNVRIDYLPMIFTKEEASEASEWSTIYTDFDMENIDKAGTVPMTYGKDIELEIAYGDYNFYMSTALPNSQYRMHDMNGQATIIYTDGNRMYNAPVIVDENTTEIVLTCFDPEDEYQYNYPKLGVILRGANGELLPDEYTVILKPKDGIMQPGFTYEYGGYVLTRTNENGEAFWRGGAPISGEYEVIAYKEELHPASEPIREPFVFGDDNTINFTYSDNVSIYEKYFEMAK